VAFLLHKEKDISVSAKYNPKFNIGTENPFKRSVSSSSRITGNTVFSQENAAI